MTMYSDTHGQLSRRHYPAQQEDIYAEDTERLYESFNDLYEDFDDGRSKTPFVIIGALLAVAIVGGGLAFAYKRGFGGSSADGVPVVVADQTPDKVEPQDPGGMEIPHQDSLIFNRINGEPTEGAGETEAAMPADEAPSEPPLTIGDLASRVTEDSRPDQPIAMADKPASVGETLLAPAGRNAELPKPLLPPGAEAPQGGAGAPAESAVLSPRKVETFTITPDGRIVSQTVDAPPQPMTSSETTMAPSGARQPLAVPSLPSAIESADGGGQPGGEVDLAAAEDARPQVPSLPGGGTASLAPSPQPKPRPTTRDLAAVRDAAPSRPAPAASEDSDLSGKFAVQVASNQRQADSLAIFADLQRRYPDLVRGYRPLIQRADLGTRGIFYRLRIGPLDTKADATRLCSSLRNAGLPGCIIRAL